MRLAIVGSTLLQSNAEAAEIIERVLDKYQPTMVVSGGAVGIDSMAAKAARTRGIDVKEYLPTRQAWLRNRPDGFWARNLRIAGDCDALVRIAAIGSKTYGSGWTRDQAKELGKPTEEFKVQP